MFFQVQIALARDRGSRKSTPCARSLDTVMLLMHDQGFTPLLSLAHLDEETASTFPLKIRM